MRPFVSCVQPLLRSSAPVAEERGTRPRGGGYCQHRPREFLDEREEVRPTGGKMNLRRTRSEIQCVPPRLMTEKSHHTRSPSAWDFMPARRTPDSNHLSSLASDSGSSSRSLFQQQTGRSSRLADLPESHGSFLRHSPESHVPDVGPSSRTDFSRLIDSQSINEDVDAAEIQRIQYEQSKKLIPMVQTRTTLMGRRSTISPITPPMGKRSPGSTTPSVAKCEAHSVAMPFGNNTNTVLKNEGLIENGFRDPFPDAKSKEKDRNTFFKSLLKNKPLRDNAQAREDDSSFNHSLKLDAKGKSSADVPLVLETKAAVEEEEAWLQVGPPSVEEERFLRLLGWNDTDDVDLLTDEEIAAFKAQYLNKTEERDTHRKAICKNGDIRSFQCSPVGHLSSFDLVAESESASMSSETGLC